jgi:hypothetical protein
MPHAVLRRGRDEGGATQGLPNAGAGARLFGNFDPFGDFDLIFGRGQTEPENHRNADPLQGAHLRRNPDLAVPRRLAAAEDGVVRLS